MWEWFSAWAMCWDCLFLKKKGSGPPLTPLFSPHPHPNCEVWFFSKNSIFSHDINLISKSLGQEGVIIDLLLQSYLSILLWTDVYRVNFCHPYAGKHFPGVAGVENSWEHFFFSFLRVFAIFSSIVLLSSEFLCSTSSDATINFFRVQYSSNYGWQSITFFIHFLSFPLSLSKITSCHLVKNRRVSVSSFILLISGVFAWLLEVSVVCSFAFCHKGKTDMYFCCFYFSAGGTKEWVTRKTREKKEGEKKKRKKGES